MNFVSKVGDVLHLADIETIYQVAKCFEFEGENYILAVSVPEKFEELFDDSKKTIEIFREVVEDNDEFFVESIEDSVLLSKLKDYVKTL